MRRSRTTTEPQLQQDWDLWHAMRSEGAKAIAELEPIERKLH